MQRVRNLLIVTSILAVTGLVGYEIVQKSSSSALGPLPGAHLANRADRAVQWNPPTGFTPVDVLLHESHEAALYYKGLATGSI